MKKVLIGLLGLLCLFVVTSCNDTTVNEDPPIDYNTPDISQGADSYIVSLSLDVSKAKVDYYLNEEFNKDNLVVTANYSDETTKDVTSLVTIDSSDFDSSKEGVYTIDVIYDDEKQQLYSSYEVVVSNLVDLITTPYIVGLTLDVNSVKTKYIYGEELEDFSNLKATIYYSDSTTKDVTIEDNKLSIDSSNLNLKQAGFYDLIVNYKDSYQASNGLSQDITVSNFYTVQVFDELTKLEFVSGNLEVLQYQNLDYSDWQVKATYYSENTAIIDVNLLAFVVDTTKAGEQDVTVSYTEYGVTKSFVVKINVIESAVTEATYTFIANDVAVGDYTSSFAWVDNAGSAPNMIKVLAGSGDNQNVSVDSNNKEQDGMSFTQRIKLGGTGNETYRSVSIDLGMFEVGVSVNVKIYALSSSSSANRELEVFENGFGVGTSLGEYQVLGKPTTGDVTVIDLTLEGGKAYSLGSTGGGINLYAIVVSSV